MTLVNGQETDLISVNDRGFLYGDGLFETILIKQEKPCYLQEHLQRLYASCKRLKIKPPPKFVLLKEINRLCQNYDKGVLKIIISRGESAGGLKVTKGKTTRVLKSYAYPKRIDKNMREGIRLKVCQTRLSSHPTLFGMKLLNWLEPALAHMELGEKYQEGLMLDYSGHIIEGTLSNFFCVKGKSILTPSLVSCGLPGIMRDKIIAASKDLGFKVIVGKIGLDDLSDFEGFFTSNSLGIFPVIKLNKKLYPKTKVASVFANKLL